MKYHDMTINDVCDSCGLSAETIENFRVECGQKWERRGHLITCFETGIVAGYGSIAAAKRESRKLQGNKSGYAGMRVTT